MNGKTEQPVTNEPRCTAAGGHAEIINVPGYPLMVRAVDYNALRAQLAEAQAICLLKELVAALDETHWSSWQSTAQFDNQLTHARNFLAEQEGRDE